MDSAVLSNLIAAAATIISGYLVFRAYRSSEALAASKETVAEMREELKHCYKQIAAYHQLEDILVEPLLDGKDMKIVKGIYRKQVVDKGLDRPFMTRTEATKRLAELERSCTTRGSR